MHVSLHSTLIARHPLGYISCVKLSRHPKRLETSGAVGAGLRPLHATHVHHYIREDSTGKQQQLQFGLGTSVNLPCLARSNLMVWIFLATGLSGLAERLGLMPGHADGDTAMHHLERCVFSFHRVQHELHATASLLKLVHGRPALLMLRKHA